MRIIVRTALGLLAAALLAYVADVAWLHARLANRGDVIGSVQVEVVVTVPLKNGRTGLMPGDTEVDRCVRALFPHLGLPPCWYLQRHTTRRVNL